MAGPQNVLVFRATDIETGITISKSYRNRDFIIVQKVSGESRLLRLDFEGLPRLMWKIRIEERKEKNKRVLAGIHD